MKIQHLRFLAAVVEHGGVVRAAEALRVSQPAVSAGLRALEEELGQPLFERGPTVGRRLRLRPNAERFHRRALAILRECDAARAEFASGASGWRRLRLGVLPTLADSDLVVAVATLRREHPHWGIEMWEGGVERLAAWLRQGRIDVAWTLVDEPGPLADVLWCEPFVGFVARDHPAVRRRPAVLTLEDLHGAPFVLRRGCEIIAEAPEVIRAAGVELRIVARAEREEVAVQLVALGMGITIAPRSLARPTVVPLPLAGLRFTRSIGLRWGDEFTPEVREAVVSVLSGLHRAEAAGDDATAGLSVAHQ